MSCWIQVPVRDRRHLPWQSADGGSCFAGNGSQPGGDHRSPQVETQHCHPYFPISDNVPERTENNCLHIKQVRTDRTRSRKSPSSIHGWIDPILAFDCSWSMFLYVNLNHASLFTWLWFPIQVDVDAALVEAERVGHACSRQFPSCSVSRIDILRLVNILGWSGGWKVNLFQCFAGFTRIRRTPFAACLCLMGCRQIRCKDRESNSWCHIIPTTATIPSHCFLNVASIY